jgi:hypothetical protein
MELVNVWVIILAISTPIAGIVGFAVQLRNVKKLRLQNEKLNLEIENLVKAQKESEKQIVSVSNDDVIKYGNKGVLYSKANKVDESMLSRGEFESSGLDWEGFFLITGAIFFLCYFCYDLYRFGKWLLSTL